MRMDRRRKRRQRANRRARIGVSIMVAALVLILSVQIVRLYQKNESYKAQEAALQVQLDEETERTQELEELEEEIDSDEYIEDIARSKLGMVKENEIIFKEE